mmetsp:Transcript_105043/g.186095  ORF Transcript_105043/g.186095 Transcript_105043/m.186095 type:complete len:490 (+) Transcript_105043:99-1568(+)
MGLQLPCPACCGSQLYKPGVNPNSKSIYTKDGPISPISPLRLDKPREARTSSKLSYVGSARSPSGRSPRRSEASLHLMRDGAERNASKQAVPSISEVGPIADDTFRPEPPSPSGKLPLKTRRPDGCLILTPPGDEPPTWTWLEEAMVPLPPELDPAEQTPSTRARTVSSREESRDQSQVVRPKKLWTHDFAVIRTSTREGFNRVAEQPFQCRPFCGQEELQDWTPVNSGQLLGFTSQKGGRQQVPNQDEFAVLHEAGYQIYLVIDGHGAEGESAAKFVRRYLIKALTGLVRERGGRVLESGELAGVFAELQKTLALAEADRSLDLTDMQHSGCTAAVALLTPARSLRGAWLGECQCLAGKRDRPDQSYSLTPPHLTTRQDGLPMTARAIGCFAYDYLLRDAEEFIEADIDHSGIDFLVLGTGGLWRGIGKDNVVDEVSKAGPYYAQHACTKLAIASQENQMRSAEFHEGPLSVQDATAITAWIGNICDS